MDALKTSFSHRSLAARSMGRKDSLSDATVAGLERFFIEGKPPFMLEPKSPVLYYLQRLRDEAHRFANGSHQTRRAMDIKKNPLDEIDGVGPGRKRALLHAFGSARGVSRASVDDLAKVDGVSEALAQRIFDFFRKS